MLRSASRREPGGKRLRRMEMKHLPSIQKVSSSARSTKLAGALGHPDDIVCDPDMTAEEKRAVLASWASDVNAVRDTPSLRQLPDGSTVELEDILRALRSLDGTGGPRPFDERRDTRRQRMQRRRGQLLWWRTGRGPRDDDDDPPPCPATIAPRPGSGGGAAFTDPTPAAA